MRRPCNILSSGLQRSFSTHQRGSRKGRGLRRRNAAAKGNLGARGLGEVLMSPEHIDQMVDVRATMPGGHLNAKTRGLDRYRRDPDRIDVDPVLAHGDAELLGLCLLAEPDWDNRRL